MHDRRLQAVAVHELADLLGAFRADGAEQHQGHLPGGGVLFQACEFRPELVADRAGGAKQSHDQAALPRQVSAQGPGAAGTAVWIDPAARFFLVFLAQYWPSWLNPTMRPDLIAAAYRDLASEA